MNGYVPVIRRTAKLEEFLDMKLDQKAVSCDVKAYFSWMEPSARCSYRSARNRTSSGGSGGSGGSKSGDGGDGGAGDQSNPGGGAGGRSVTDFDNGISGTAGGPGSITLVFSA